MAETVPTSEKGYVVPKGLESWWPDLGVIEKVPELRYPQCLTVFEEMLKDPQVFSTTQAVTLPLRSTGWWVDPNGADAEIVQLVAEDLGLPVRGVETLPPVRARDRFSFPEHLDLALDALPFGHAAFEQQARMVAGRARLRKLAWRPQRSIEKWHVARDGGLESIEQAGVDGKIDVSRLVVYSYRRRGGAWIGQSILRQSHKFWLLKERTLLTQQLSLDRTGVGTPVYTAAPAPLEYTPEEQTAYAEAQREAGLAIAKHYRSGERSGASLPHGATLEVLGVKGTLPDTDKVIRYYDEQIVRSTLANFLSLGGENSRGSYALGSTFADFFIQSLQATARWVCDVLTQHVVEDIVDWNWGPDVRAPRIVCDEIGSKHPATAEAISILVNSGAIQPDPTLEYAVRATHGLPQRGTAWASGDLDLITARVEALKTLMDAGATFETAKVAVGLPNLEEAPRE